MNEKTKQEWHAITVTLPKEGSEWISHLLFELGSVGNIEEAAPDPTLIAMKGYFPTEIGSDAAIIQQINELMLKRGITPLSTYATTIKIQNWAKAAQQMFSPIKITERLTIVNPWDNYKPAPGEEVIVINPGMAFGTGLHATTQLAARLIIYSIDLYNAKKICDVGSGSGILSIIAAKHGAERIEAVEIDSDARDSALENFKRNECLKNIKVADKIEEAGTGFDIVAANILFSIIIEIKEELVKRVRPGGYLIISGITAEEDSRFIQAFSDPQLTLIRKETQDDWMAYLYRIDSDIQK